MPRTLATQDMAARERRAVCQVLRPLTEHLRLVHAWPVGKRSSAGGVPPQCYGQGIVLQDSGKEEGLL